MRPNHPASSEPAPHSPDDQDRAPHTLVSTTRFRVAELVAMIDTGTIDLGDSTAAPHAEHGSAEHASRVVESMLLRIPVPAMYFHEHSDSTMQVVNGRHCLAAIHAYVRGMFPLRKPNRASGCLSDPAGATFPELALPLRQQLLRTRIVAHIVDSSVPQHLLCSLLRRVNAGWVPLE